MTSPTAISAGALTKSYGEHDVLDSVDLEVAEGSVFALLGPNGSGKTTTVRILSTLTRADSGQARVQATTLWPTRTPSASGIGVTGQFSAVDNLLTGAESHPCGHRAAPPRDRPRTRPDRS